MALNTVSLSFGYYPDPTQGRPVFNGSIFIGEPDLDPTILANQKTITIRQEGVDTPSVPQPISTSAGGVPVFNGSAAEILVEGAYSIAVLNAQDTQVYYVAEVSTDGSYNQGGTGAISRTVTSRLQDLVSLFDFMTTAQISDVKAGTLSVDVIGAVQSALDSGESLWAPAGKYLCSAPPTITNNGTALFGAGTYKAEFITNFAAGDSFLVTGGAGEINNIQLENFSVLSSVVKTSGSGVHFEHVKGLTVNSVHCGRQSDIPTHKHWDCYELVAVENANIFDIWAIGGNNGMVINDAATGPNSALINVSNGRISTENIGLLIGGGVAAAYFDKLDINDCDTALVRIDQSLFAEGNAGIRFGPGTFLDGQDIGGFNVQPGIIIDDPGLKELELVGTRLSLLTYGIDILQASATDTEIKIVGSIIRTCDNDGIRIGADLKLLSVNSTKFRDIDGIGVNSTVDFSSNGAGAGVFIFPDNTFENVDGGDVEWGNIPVLAGTSIQRTLGDDVAYSFIPRDGSTQAATGFIGVTWANQGNFLLAFYRASSSPIMTVLHASGVDVTTGVLTGTTGVDGNFTVSAAADGKIYVENRSGGGRGTFVTLLGAYPGANTAGVTL